MAFSELRVDYEGGPLTEADALPDPIDQLRGWFDEAVAAELPIANGMTLATTGRDGQPAARIVLLKEIDARGLVFFTNYDSRKGRELAANPRAAALFWWTEHHRQVQVEGAVERVSAEESDDYFGTRPRQSNLSAMASKQSSPVADRAELEAAVAAVTETWDGKDLERPESWGGYRLVPRALEFFQGRPDRLHDRLRYRLQSGVWTMDRLAP